jgi:hypothetical protein
MIRDLSETLRAILTQPGLPAELHLAAIVFDHPDESFHPTVPTIDLFLFDVRENTDLRLNEPSIVRNNGSASVIQPPRRVLCTYLATAWVTSGTDPVLQEHRLLTQVLQVLSQYPTIPTNLAQGTIKTNDPPVPLQVAVGTPATGISEFWSAVGAKLRPSLTVEATIALPVFTPQSQVLAITSKVATSTIQPGGAPAADETFFHISGRITDSSGAAVRNATVTAVEAKLQTVTDANGVYWLGPLSARTYTIAASAGSSSKQVSCQVPAPQNANYDVQFS